MNNPLISRIKINEIRYLNYILFLFFIISCSENQIKAIGKKRTNIPSKEAYNVFLTRKDSGYITLKLRTPEMIEYGFVDSPYVEFPKGVKIEFFQKGKKNPGFLRANYAKLIEMKGWYEAKGDVLIINPDGDTLKTQRIFWNKRERKIFTRDTVVIIAKDSTVDPLISVQGLEASEDFKQYKFYKNHGNMYFKN